MTSTARPWRVRVHRPRDRSWPTAGAYAKREGAFIRAGCLMAAGPRLYAGPISVEIMNIDTGERWLTSEFGAKLRRAT